MTEQITRGRSESNSAEPGGDTTKLMQGVIPVGHIHGYIEVGVIFGPNPSDPSLAQVDRVRGRRGLETIAVAIGETPGSAAAGERYQRIIVRPWREGQSVIAIIEVVTKCSLRPESGRQGQEAERQNQSEQTALFPKKRLLSRGNPIRITFGKCFHKKY